MNLVAQVLISALTSTVAATIISVVLKYRYDVKLARITQELKIAYDLTQDRIRLRHDVLPQVANQVYRVRNKVRDVLGALEAGTALEASSLDELRQDAMALRDSLFNYRLILEMEELFRLFHGYLGKVEFFTSYLSNMDRPAVSTRVHQCGGSPIHHAPVRRADRGARPPPQRACRPPQPMLTCACATSAVTSSVPNHAIYQANRRVDMPLHISTAAAAACRSVPTGGPAAWREQPPPGSDEAHVVQVGVDAGEFGGQPLGLLGQQQLPDRGLRVGLALQQTRRQQHHNRVIQPRTDPAHGPLRSSAALQPPLLQGQAARAAACRQSTGTRGSRHPDCASDLPTAPER
jgi:hypothetical protein